jgi:hypothetical protein
MPTDDELRAIRSDLAAIVARFDSLLEVKPAAGTKASTKDAALHCTTAIEWALADHGEPMSPVQIHEAIKQIGRSDRKDTVQVTTYDLWKRGRIDKVGRGLYTAKAG